MIDLVVYGVWWLFAGVAHVSTDTIPSARASGAFRMSYREVHERFFSTSGQKEAKKDEVCKGAKEDEEDEVLFRSVKIQY